jgi:hypothetical protein
LLAGPLCGEPATTYAAGTAATGCVDQWLFNGVWRVEVTDISPYVNPGGGPATGWQVTEVWRNGTTQEAAPGDSFLKDQELELGNGSILASASTSGSMALSVIASHSLPASGEFTYKQVFVIASFDQANKPKAVDINFDGDKLAESQFHPHFTTKHYNFHFNLGCKATGKAAEAQGGSTQIAGTEGCLNQWMSNKVWRVRATAVAPDTGDGPGPQLGWMVTEEWTNLSGHPLAPGDTQATDQYIALQSGATISSTNSAGTTMNQAQLTARTFPARSSFTYQQRFRQLPLNAADVPIRLLVTFNATAESRNPNIPHFSNPANFRIKLTCKK